MKSSLLTLLLLTFYLSGFAQVHPQRRAAYSGNWFITANWVGNKVPVSGDSIVIPAGITITLDTSQQNKTLYYYLSPGVKKTSRLTVSGTLILGTDVNLFLYSKNKDTTSIITVNSTGVIKGGNNGTHIKFINLVDTTNCELYEGGIFANPYNPHRTAHPIAPGETAPKIVGPVTISAATPQWCYIASNPLPITLVSFDATYQPAESRVKLEWLTSQEINNDHFTVERSRNALHFEEVLQHPGAGNSNERLAYEVYDIQPLAGIAYYRLRQTDYDGQESYSKIVSVTADGTFSWRVSPNPSNGNINLLASGDTQSLDVRVFSSIGKLLYQGAQAGQLPISLSAGMYYVRVSKDGRVTTQKVIVQ